MDSEVWLTGTGRSREPSVLVAAWLLAELDERAISVDTGPNMVRLVFAGPSKASVCERMTAVLRERRFAGWILDDLHT